MKIHDRLCRTFTGHQNILIDYLLIHLFIYLYIYIFIYLFISLFIYLSIHLFIHFIYIYLFTYLFIYLHIYSSIYLFIYLLIHLSIYLLIYLLIHLFIFLFIKSLFNYTFLPNWLKFLLWHHNFHDLTPCTLSCRFSIFIEIEKRFWRDWWLSGTPLSCIKMHVNTSKMRRKCHKC